MESLGSGPELLAVPRGPLAVQALQQLYKRRVITVGSSPPVTVEERALPDGLLCWQSTRRGSEWLAQGLAGQQQQGITLSFSETE